MGLWENNRLIFWESIYTNVGKATYCKPEKKKGDRDKWKWKCIDYFHSELLLFQDGRGLGRIVFSINGIS